MTPRDLKTCLLQTLGLSALVALVAGFRWSADWATRYAAVSLMAWINWVALSGLLSAFVHRRFKPAMGWLAAKAALVLFAMAVYFPMAGIEASSFLAGFNTFFLVLLFRALGMRLAVRRDTVRAADIQFLTGRTANG